MTITLQPQVAVTPARPSVPTLVDHFWDQVGAHADRPAMYAYCDGRWEMTTWGRFGDSVWRVAAYLLSENLAEGEHVAIWSENRPEWTSPTPQH